MAPSFDPFLAAHQLDPRVFDISWGLWPVSIRDQMLRGRTAVERLVDLDFVHAGAPLLVVGAGVAGVTAAITAALRRVPTTLVEAEPEAFTLQAQCDTRYLHPCQYDWPLPHWRSNGFPPPAFKLDRPLPLPYQSGPASNLAAQWRLFLRVAEEEAGEDLLELCYGVKPARLQSLKDSVQCSFDLAPTATKKPRQEKFGAVISAAGFGSERVRTHDSREAFASGHFWQNDQLESLKGLRSPRVVIAGSGDGALQDFLRVASGMRSAEEMMMHLLPTGMPISFRERIQAAEDQAVRAASWAGTSEHDHAIQVQLHERYTEAIRELFSQPPFNLMPARIDLLLKGRPFSQLTLVHPCKHFSQSYALNRVLVCMMQEALRRGVQRERVEVLGETGVAEVQCAGCKTPPEADQCFGRPHQVRLNPRDCSGSKPVDRTTEAEVVVLRLGIDRGAKPMLGERPGGGLRRQLLPYFPAR